MVKPIGFYTDGKKRVRPISRRRGLKGSNKRSRKYEASLTVSRKTQTRLQGVKEIAKIIACKNPIVDNVLTAKEAYDATHKVVYGKKAKLPKIL